VFFALVGVFARAIQRPSGLPPRKASSARHQPNGFMRPAFGLLLVAAGFLSAQETPTERDAARGVVAKMDSLERRLNVTAMVARLAAPNSARDQVAARAKELMDTELLALGDDITRHPEIGFEEKRSVQVLADYLRKHDFDVQMGTPPSLPTAFV